MLDLLGNGIGRSVDGVLSLVRWRKHSSFSFFFSSGRVGNCFLFVCALGFFLSLFSFFKIRSGMLWSFLIGVGRCALVWVGIETCELGFKIWAFLEWLIGWLGWIRMREDAGFFG